MSDKKMTYEQMEFLYQTAINAANKTLFEDNFEQHGWTEKEFTETMLWMLKAIQEGKVQRWVN
jgi:hypothetical protein